MGCLERIKELCRINDIHPARSKGQNFLISESVYEKIIDTAELKPDDVVLEVGPGFGFLTVKLARLVKKVIAVELDDKLAKILKTGLIGQGIRNAEVVNEDILKFSIFNFQFSNNFQFKNLKIKKLNNVNNDARYEMRDMRYKIVANLPYNITSIFLRKFLAEEKVKPELMVLMLQKEVAERIVAKPPKMSLLAVSVQFFAQPEIVDYVRKDNFWPEPEVDSAIIKMKTHPFPPFAKGRENDFLPLTKGERRGSFVDKEKDFFKMVKFGFSAKRKMLKNNLAAGYQIDPENVENYLKLAEINSKARAQELSIIDWLRLFEVIRKKCYN